MNKQISIIDLKNEIKERPLQNTFFSERKMGTNSLRLCLQY